MSNRTPILAIGVFVILVVGAIYFIEIKPMQDFEKEVDFYLIIANLRPDLIVLEYKDDALDDFRGNIPEIWKENRMGLREILQQELNDPFYSIQIQIDRKNRIIAIYQNTFDILYLQGWYAA